MVRSSNDGRAALATAEGFDPEIVILDLRLRDMSGYELATELRSRAGAAVLVALTGLEGSEVRSRCRSAGFDCHLVKPIRDFEGFRHLVGSLEVREDLRLR